MDLIVGGSIILALFILVAGILWLKEVAVSSKMVSYSVLFPNISTLQAGDPVSVNGVKTGSVRAIRLRGQKVAVVIDIDRDVALTDSSRIVVQNIGLMGERGVGIALSNKGTVIKPITRRDTTYIEGFFDTGIAEAMGMLGAVLGEVEVLAGNVSSIVGSTIGDTVFLKLFHTMVARLDTVTNIANRIVVKNQPLLNKSIQNITAVSSDLKSLLDNNSNHIDSIMANGHALTGYALSIASRVDSLSSTVKQMVDEVDRGEGSIGMLVKDEQFYRDLKKTVLDLDTLVTQVQDDALKLRIRLGFGKPKKNRL